MNILSCFGYRDVYANPNKQLFYGKGKAFHTLQCIVYNVKLLTRRVQHNAKGESVGKKFKLISVKTIVKDTGCMVKCFKYKKINHHKLLKSKFLFPMLYRINYIIYFQIPPCISLI